MLPFQYQSKWLTLSIYVGHNILLINEGGVLANSLVKLCTFSRTFLRGANLKYIHAPVQLVYFIK